MIWRVDVEEAVSGFSSISVDVPHPLISHCKQEGRLAIAKALTVQKRFMLSVELKLIVLLN